MGLSSYGEKRKVPRFPVRLPIDYWETPNIVQAGLVAEISETGLRIHSIHQIQIGTELKIRVYLSKDEYRFDCIQGRGKIIWRSLHREADWRGYKYGLYLTQMALGDRERLKQLIRGLLNDGEDNLLTVGPVAKG